METKNVATTDVVELARIQCSIRLEHLQIFHIDVTQTLNTSARMVNASTLVLYAAVPLSALMHPMKAQDVFMLQHHKLVAVGFHVTTAWQQPMLLV
jgi:hypothetical protein